MLSCEALLIYVLEIEAILNLRLITYRSNDLNDLRALTPGHFQLDIIFRVRQRTSTEMYHLGVYRNSSTFSG
ncbi:hypothetical protein M0804_013179 [Polistes exclamans]|nr:hypothetical protein M0804_013179 [Polistes exclamans]